MTPPGATRQSPTQHETRSDRSGNAANGGRQRTKTHRPNPGGDRNARGAGGDSRPKHKTSRRLVLICTTQSTEKRKRRKCDATRHTELCDPRSEPSDDGSRGSLVELSGTEKCASVVRAPGMAFYGERRSEEKSEVSRECAELRSSSGSWPRSVAIQLY